MREVEEETVIHLSDALYKGNVTCEVDNANSGGMYVFTTELPKGYDYLTPVKRKEGILDWKKIDWMLHPEHVKMANVKYFFN